MKKCLVAFALAAALAGCAGTRVSAPPLIPREVIFAPELIKAPLISPDGRLIAAIMPLEGVDNIYVFPADDPDARRPVTHFRDRDVNVFDVAGEVTYFWTGDSRRLVFLRDANGDEAHHVLVVDVETGEASDLTPIDGVRAVIFGRSDDVPNEILVGLDDRIPGRLDLYRLNLETGRRRLVERNDRFLGYFADNALNPRVAQAIENTPEGVAIVQYYRAPESAWRAVGSFPLSGSVEEGSWPRRGLGFDADNVHLRQIWSASGDTDAIVEVNYETGEMDVLAQDPRADISEAMVDPRTHEVQAWVRHFTRREWVVLDPDIEADMRYLQSFRDGDLRVVSRSNNDQRWIVRYTLSDAPETYYLYERASRSTRLLFEATPALASAPLVKLFPIVTRSSDGFDLVSYYSLPLTVDHDQDGFPDRPAPFVVLIHGGPSDERAQYAFGAIVQLFANRGYGVLYPNFRGSSGFGRNFLVAQNGEWGRAMSRDVDEQVERMIAEGFAERGRIGVIGGSYGGYATLVAMTQSPDLYRCGVSLVGPANLETFIENRPPEWSLDAWATRIGDPRTQEGRALLRDRSPIHFVDQVRGPLLIVQGANDRRVPQSESDQMAAALDAQGVAVTYALYPDEGHGLLRQPNQRSFQALVDVFFGECLGGRFEPIGDALEGASMQVPVGVDRLPGLREALAAGR